jgi:hypothetical protein
MTDPLLAPFPLRERKGHVEMQQDAAGSLRVSLNSPFFYPPRMGDRRGLKGHHIGEDDDGK